VCIDWAKRKLDRTMPEAATSAAAHTPAAADEDDEGGVSMQVESEDLPEEMSMKDRFSLQQLLQNMSPSACLTPATDAVSMCAGSAAFKSCMGSEREELESQVPGLLKEVRGGGKPRTVALQKLYRLTDREHHQNRVPVVCTTKFETVQNLVTALGDDVPHSDRRLALLILNNLCIPTENKAAILFGEPSEHLITALLYLLRRRLAESYLASVTLLNLSYLQDDHAKNMLFSYVPITDGSNEAASETYSYRLPIDNPLSLIRTLESILKDFVVYVGPPHDKSNSVEQQCVRWSMNVARNLVTVHENAVAVGTRTLIPAIAAECLSHADTSNLSRWTRDSMEDACLMLLVHVCKIDDCLNVLKANDKLTEQVVTVCETLESSGEGIHQKRAEALLERFEEALSARSVGFSV